MFCYATSQHYSANNIQACGSAISKIKEIETRPSLPVMIKENKILKHEILHISTIEKEVTSLKVVFSHHISE